MKKAVEVSGVKYGPVSAYDVMLDTLMAAGFEKDLSCWKKVSEKGKFIASIITLEDGRKFERILPLEELANVG
jgi:hypothetical protein